MNKVAIYARSAEMNAEKIERQLYLCRAYAANHSMEIVAEYADNGCSGLSAERTGLNNLKANDEWNTLLVAECSVLFRKHTLLKNFIEHATKKGRKVISVDLEKELSFVPVSGLLQDKGVAANG